MVVFGNVLSHASTQKSPKCLNLHKHRAEFHLGFLFTNIRGFGGSLEDGFWLLQLGKQPAGEPMPTAGAFGARGSALQWLPATASASPRAVRAPHHGAPGAGQLLCACPGAAPALTPPVWATDRGSLGGQT